MNACDAPFPMKAIPEPCFPERTVSCGDYPSIQAAVDACAALGGGTVLIPEGAWQSGPIHLHSRIRLHLADNACVAFDPEPERYLPPVLTRWEGIECYNYSPLIYARDCEQIAITGKGTLFGNGQAWWDWKQRQQAAADALYRQAVEQTPVDQRVYGTREAALRPSFVQLINCRRVLLEDFRIVDGPQWTLHPVYCEDVIVRRVHVSTHGHNTDGLNPDSCRNVLIEDSDFSTGDDCIALNAGMNEDGWRVGKPCENVVIRNCTMTGGHGAVVIGSAVSGGVRNVLVTNCRIQDTMQGLRIKSMRGRGGYVENVCFQDIDILHVSNEAMQINMFYEFTTVMPATQAPSVFRHIAFRRIRGRGADTGILMRGLPEQRLEDIAFEDVDLTAEKAMLCSDGVGVTFDHVRIRPPMDGCGCQP